MEQPNYYAILPADIRYSKEISMFQKLLYAEITALTQKDGYCWASNTYFSEIYEVHPVTISKAINDLAKKGFLKIEIDKENGNARKIYVGEITKKSGKTTISQKTNTYKGKHLDPISENANTPISENAKHNNINNNIKYNNKKKKKLNNSNELFNKKEKNFSFLNTQNKNSLLEIFKKEIDNEEYITALKAKYGLDNESLKNIAGEFLLYRTEKNQNGIKEKWQMEKSFDVRRRFYTRLSNELKFAGKKRFTTNKGVGIVEI